MKGFIYILTNLLFGSENRTTKSDPNGRAMELSDTSSLPFAFELAWYAFVEEHKNAERLIHMHFANACKSKARVF